MKEKLIDFMRSLKGTEQDYKIEWGWERFMVGGKMYAALLQPGEEHKEYAGHQLLTVKCEPLRGEMLREQYPQILPGFYMNKKNWISVCLNADVPEELLLALCQESYQLVFHKLTKKLQQEILTAKD